MNWLVVLIWGLVDRGVNWIFLSVDVLDIINFCLSWFLVILLICGRKCLVKVIVKWRRVRFVGDWGSKIIVSRVVVFYES